MATTALTTEAAREVLLEGLDDYLGLWEFVASVRDNGTVSPRTVREEVLTLVRKLLEEGLVEAGFPTREGGFAPEDAEAPELLERISGEWDELNREPDIGDIVWFKLTDKGRRHARKLDTAG